MFTAVDDHEVPVVGNLLCCQPNCEAAFGVDFRRQQRNFFQLAVPRGNMVFGGGYTQDLSTGNGGNGLADLFLGVAQHVEQDTLSGADTTRYWDLAGFVQDDYRVRPNLTLNLGMRYDIASPANGRVANFDMNAAWIDAGLF